MNQNKIVIVVGPTSSGKSELAAALAKRFNGEIISCDSRQIYKGMDLGTGKIPGRWHKFYGRKIYAYKNIPHHLIDFASPRAQFSVARYKALAQKAIKDISKRGHLPIICGGTMHWIDAVVYDQNLPDVKPNTILRERLEKQLADRLYQRLMKLDPARAKTIDRHNKRRLIRALEIVISTGRSVPPLLARRGVRGEVESMDYDTLWIGLKLPQKTLDQKIKKRLLQRIKAGMIEEVKRLHSPSPLARGDVPSEVEGQRGRTAGLSWRRLENFGLEYRFASRYLQAFPHSSPWKGQEARRGWNDMITKLFTAIRKYSKRQMTWWKRNKEITWIRPDFKKALKLTKRFLT